jgi:hypothetical protein
MFNTDQLALHMAKKSIDKELEKQDALDRGILSDITLKNETSNPLKLKTGMTVNDEMKVDMYGKVLNGFYKDDEGNIYQREINGKYKSLTGEYHKKTKKGKSVKVETESGKTMEIEPEGIESEGLGLKAVNLATLDNVKDKKIIDFLDKEMPGLKETAIQLQKEKGKDISVSELNATTLKRYKDSQSKQISMFQKMIVPDKDNKIDGVKLTDLASQLSGRVDESNVYMFNEKGTKSIPNDDVIKDIAKGLEDYYWKKDNKPTSGGWFSGKKVDYKIVGKFGENVLANPNSYVIKDNNGNKYIIDTATPEQKNRSFRFQPMVNAIDKPGRAVSFPSIPPLSGVSIENLSNGKQLAGMNIIPSVKYSGQPLDNNTMVGDVSIIAQPKFDANNGMLDYGDGSDLVLKFTERIFNPQTEKFTKGEDYIMKIGNNNFTALNEILRNQ